MGMSSNGNDLSRRVAEAQGWIYAEIPDMLDPLLKAEVSKWWIDEKSGIRRHLIDRYSPSTDIAQAMAFAEWAIGQRDWDIVMRISPGEDAVFVLETEEETLVTDSYGIRGELPKRICEAVCAALKK